MRLISDYLRVIDPLITQLQKRLTANEGTRHNAKKFEI